MPYYNQIPNYYSVPYWQPSYPTNAQASAMYPSGVSQTAPIKVMEWVEGEVGAKAFQMPPGLPANQPIPLWDNTDTIIWMKSWNQFGAPNPMQKLHYTMPEAQQSSAMLPSGSEANSSYATKDDIQSLREEIRGMMDSTLRNTQNGRFQKDVRSEPNGKSSV